MAILESKTKTGLSWVSESIVLLKQAPRQWLLLAMVYLGVFILIPSFPQLQFFAFVTILIWPIFITIAMRLYRNVEFKKTENITTIMQLIQPKMRRLLMLGVVNLCYFIIVNIILSSDIQAVTAVMNQQTEANEQEVMLAMQTMMPIFLKLIVLFIPLMMAVWFAPMLIAFNDYSVVRALKSSVAGSLQYMVAMTAAWLLISVGIVTLMLGTSLFAGLFALIHLAFAQSLMSVLVFGCVLLSIALTLAFQYVSYRDIFRAAPIA